MNPKSKVTKITKEQTIIKKKGTQIQLLLEKPDGEMNRYTVSLDITNPNNGGMAVVEIDGYLLFAKVPDMLDRPDLENLHELSDEQLTVAAKEIAEGLANIAHLSIEKDGHDTLTFRLILNPDHPEIKISEGRYYESDGNLYHGQYAGLFEVREY